MTDRYFDLWEAMETVVTEKAVTTYNRQLGCPCTETGCFSQTHHGRSCCNVNPTESIEPENYTQYTQTIIPPYTTMN